MEQPGRTMRNGLFVADQEVVALIEYMKALYGATLWRVYFEWYDEESIKDSMPAADADAVIACSVYSKICEDSMVCKICINADHTDTNESWESVIIEAMAQFQFIGLLNEMKYAQKYLRALGNSSAADYVFNRLHTRMQQLYHSIGRIVGGALMDDYEEALGHFKDFGDEQ